MAAIPPPARKIPTAISQGIETRSARWPIDGWMIDDDAAWQKIKKNAVAAEMWSCTIKSGTRTGIKL
jgi:hypothetical protein